MTYDLYIGSNTVGVSFAHARKPLFPANPSGEPHKTILVCTTSTNKSTWQPGFPVPRPVLAFLSSISSMEYDEVLLQRMRLHFESHVCSCLSYAASCRQFRLDADHSKTILEGRAELLFLTNLRFGCHLVCLTGFLEHGHQELHLQPNVLPTAVIPRLFLHRPSPASYA